MKTKLLLFSLYLLQLLLYAGNAGELQKLQEPKGSSIKADVALVSIDVSVRDKDGGFVGNLSAKDFTVYDNGVAQKIDIFSRDEMPLDVALIVDGSFAAQAYKLELQKAAMTAIPQWNLKNDRVALFCYGAWLDGYAYQLTGLTQDQVLLTHQLGNLRYGLTDIDIRDSLWEAALYLRTKGGPHRRRAIILISDNYGLAAHSYKETLDEMLDAGAILYSIQFPRNTNDVSPEERKAMLISNELTLRPWNSNRVLIDAIPNPNEIAIMARETGGVVLNAPSPSDLAKALNTAILNLKETYTMGFYPSDRGREDSYHALEVQINSNAKYSVQCRKGYSVHAPDASTMHQKVQSSAGGRYQNNNSDSQYLRAMAHFNFNNQMPRAGFMASNYWLFDKSTFQHQSTDIIGNNKLGQIDKPIEFSGSGFLTDFFQKRRATISLFADEHIDFSAVAKRGLDPKGKPNATVDLQIDAAPLFFDFFDDRYRTFVSVIVYQQDEPIYRLIDYLISYPEEKFRRVIQSKISVSFTMEPSKQKDLQIFVIQHCAPGKPMGRLGIQSVQIAL